MKFVNQNVEKAYNLIHKNCKIIKDINAISINLPDLLVEEIDNFVKTANQTKKHKLSFLRNHYNLSNNQFQISVSKILFENSFVFPFLINFGQYYLTKFLKGNFELGSFYRQVSFSDYGTHFDSYDFWINYSYKNNYNE